MAKTKQKSKFSLILTIVLILIALGATMFLTSKSQDTRNKAAEETCDQKCSRQATEQCKSLPSGTSTYNTCVARNKNSCIIDCLKNRPFTIPKISPAVRCQYEACKVSGKIICCSQGQKCVNSRCMNVPTPKPTITVICPQGNEKCKLGNGSTVCCGQGQKCINSSCKYTDPTPTPIKTCQSCDCSCICKGNSSCESACRAGCKTPTPKPTLTCEQTCNGNTYCLNQCHGANPTSTPYPTTHPTVTPSRPTTQFYPTSTPRPTTQFYPTSTPRPTTQSYPSPTSGESCSSKCSRSCNGNSSCYSACTSSCR